jgi:hypothetical protein
MNPFTTCAFRLIGQAPNSSGRISGMVLPVILSI